MSDGMFRTVRGLRSGYDPDEVDEFFAHARSMYESAPAGAIIAAYLSPRSEDAADMTARSRAASGSAASALE